MNYDLFMEQQDSIETLLMKYSQISAPLYKLLRKNVKYKWNTDHQQNFDMLKEKINKCSDFKISEF